MGPVRDDGWRRATDGSQRAARRIRRAIERNRRLDRAAWRPVSEHVGRLTDEIGAVADAGDTLDRSVALLDPDVLHARLATFEEQAASEPSPELELAIRAVERDLERRRDLLSRSGRARVQVDRALARLDDLARRLEDGYGLGEPGSAARVLDAHTADLAALRSVLEDVPHP